MKKTYTVNVKGADDGQLDLVVLKLGNVDVDLDSNDDITYTNDGVSVEFEPPLLINLEIHAFGGTTWKVTISEKGKKDPCYEESGETGDEPGPDKPNISVRRTNTDCR